MRFPPFFVQFFLLIEITQEDVIWITFFETFFIEVRKSMGEHNYCTCISMGISYKEKGANPG